MSGRKKKLSVLVTAIAVCLLLPSVCAADTANTPFYSYTYDSDGDALSVPAPYVVDRVIYGEDIGAEAFVSLDDVFRDDESGRIYLTDSGTNTVTVLESDYSPAAVISRFSNGTRSDALKSPKSTVVRDGRIYIADTGNQRIVVLDAKSLDPVEILERPEISILDSDYVYSPTRIAIDLKGRLYVIAQNINEGVILLDSDGSFIRFVAAPKVELSAWNRFLKLFMTKEQKANLEKAVPTEYSSILMDQDGFLYLTSSDPSVHPITRMNSQGADILKYDGDSYPDGDSRTIISGYGSVQSVFVDIDVDGNGIYSALDSGKGRIFTYDAEGNLLFVFGGPGAQKGTFYAPSAIERSGDMIMVTDRYYGTVTVFRRTAFGQAVEAASVLSAAGESEDAETAWKEVLHLCPQYGLAGIALARIKIENGDYGAAMDMLEGTGEMEYYSKAFEGARDAFIRSHFRTMVLFIPVIAAVIIVFMILKRKYGLLRYISKSRLYKELVYAKYCMFHPFDGFWDLKREKRGSLRGANILAVLFIIGYALRTQMGGYLFTGALPGEINIIFEMLKVVIPLGLWIISNWCFTTLMDGEGTMKDIYIATAYSLAPYILTAVPLWLLTRILSLDEAFIFTAVDTAVLIWTLALIFFSMMITHDYTLSRAVIVAGLTLIGICLIMFIALTFANVMQGMWSFGSDIYSEFTYRQ